MLDNLILTSRVNKEFLFTGIDSLEFCCDRQHFENYPNNITYSYNTRGFRDDNFPDSFEELKNSIWCFGDSFTVGIGNPIEHIWPKRLQSRLKRRCINISLDGASNDWIYRKIKDVITQVDPHNIIAHWSFLSRYEYEDETLSDENRRRHCHPKDWIINNNIYYQKKFNTFLNSLPNNVIHTAIPGYNMFGKNFAFDKPVYEVSTIDLGRDGYHYGPKTADILVNYIVNKLKVIT